MTKICPWKYSWKLQGNQHRLQKVGNFILIVVYVGKIPQNLTSGIYRNFTIHPIGSTFAKILNRTREITKMENNNNTRFLHGKLLNTREKSRVVKDKYIMWNIVTITQNLTTHPNWVNYKEILTQNTKCLPLHLNPKLD